MAMLSKKLFTIIFSRNTDFFVKFVKITSRKKTAGTVACFIFVTYITFINAHHCII